MWRIEDFISHKEKKIGNQIYYQIWTGYIFKEQIGEYMKEKQCPICKKPLTKWYSGVGGSAFIGCTDILCEYKEEI